MSASSSQRETGGDGHNGNNNGRRRRRRRRAREQELLEEESSSAAAAENSNAVWPEPFLEALATHVAIDASRNLGRLAAAVALSNLFQVCSTWRAVSRSDRLWQRLTSHIWARDTLLHDTWHNEYIYRHRSASNFRSGTYIHTLLDFNSAAAVGDDPVRLICRRLALSDTHLAAGFGDGVVRLFLLRTRRHTRTLRPRQRDRLGPFSRAVSGIILSEDRVVFASLDGDVHVAGVRGGTPARRAVVGDAFTNGALVDFAGFGRWWVGLFAGVPGRAFHLWDGVSEQRVYIGGSLTDPEAVMGWHQLTELTESVARVHVTSHDSAVACTSSRVIIFDLANGELVLREEEEYPVGLIVASVDVSNSTYVTVDRGGNASVRRSGTLEEVCRFVVFGGGDEPQWGLMGCMNGGYALMCAGGIVRVWGVEHGGQYLHSLREGVGDPTTMVANDRHVAAYCNDMSLHLWDFEPQD